MTIKRHEPERRPVPGWPYEAADNGEIYPEVPLTLRDDGRLEVTLFSPDGAPRKFLRAAVVVAAFTGKRPEDVGHVLHINGYLTLDSINNLELTDHDETADIRPTAKLSDGQGKFIEYEIEYHDDPQAYTIEEAKKLKRRIQ